MNDTKAKKSVGFFVLAAAAVVSVISIVLYGSAMNKTTNAYGFMIAAAVVAVAALVLSAVKGSKLANWGGFCAAVLMMAGLAWSLTAMVDAIGYVISGLYQFSLLKTYITFAICGGIAWVLFLASSFMNVVSE
ncbi:MAG: hypothetical protein J6E40_01305 [Lachnospiraceae bacterium]|nr:hypothetical protein [Lachnospiraceae bacterium]